MGSWSSIYNNAMYGIKYNTSTIARLEEQQSTGSKIIRFSDDPANANRISTLLDNAKSLEEYTNNIREVEMLLNEADNAMSSMSDLVSRVSVLVTQASNGTYQVANREAMAEEIDSILEQMVGLANHKVLGKYVFGGMDSIDAPYTVEREDGKISSVSYGGSQYEQLVPVGPGVKFSGLLVGDDIFSDDNRQDPVFTGNTGASSGIGTSNVSGDLWLDVKHTGTDFDTASTGLTAGTSSTGGDTILGTHSISIDNVAKTISLDGGVAISYTGTETDLKLTNSDGDVAYVNTTAGLNTGTFNITANGELSIAGGTAAAIDFTDDHISVIDPETGKFLYVDGRNIIRTGTEAVQVPGTYDLFNTLVSARDMMANTRNLSLDEQINFLGQIGGSLEQVSKRFTQKMTVVGGRLGGLDQLGQTLDNLQFNNTSEASGLQQADVVEIAVELARAEVFYQASLQVAGKVLSMSLLDYI